MNQKIEAIDQDPPGRLRLDIELEKIEAIDQDPPVRLRLDIEFEILMLGPPRLEMLETIEA